MDNYAAALLNRARKEGRLEEYYNTTLALVRDVDEGLQNIPEELREFLESVSGAPVKPMLERFLELAREDLNIVDVEVVSAFPLTQAQLEKIECFIIQVVKKRISIRTEVDPSILGGLRVSIGNYVVDNSIKSEFEQIRKSLYEEVYFRHD